MIPQEMESNQVPDRRPRRERRPEILAEKRRLKKALKQARKKAMAVDFDNVTVTGHGNMQFIEEFKLAIGFKELLAEKVSLEKGSNSVYSPADLLDWLTDALALGVSRFDHLDELKNDPGYLLTKGLERFPDESTFRNLFSDMTDHTFEELEAILVALLNKRAKLEGPRSIWVDIDDTVIVLYGNQEKGEIGYNPNKRGRKSYLLRVATIHETREVVAMELLGGKASAHGIGDFFEKITKNLPSNYVLEGIRADSGFFSESNLTWIEDQEVDYHVKAKQYSTIKKVITHLNKMEKWEEIDDTYSVAECRFPLETWSFARRFVFIREEMPPKESKQPQLDLEIPPEYKYQVIVTRSEEPAVEVWRNYNPRCDIENCIKELQYGFGSDEASQQVFLKNACFAMCKAITYNLMLWFKSALLTDEVKSYQAETLRRQIISIPGNIVNVGGGRKRVRLAPNPWLKKVVCTIERNLALFFETLWKQTAMGPA